MLKQGFIIKRCDSEFRYTQTTIPTSASINLARVIYLGTFRRLFFLENE